MRSSAGIDRCRAKTRRWRQAAVDADKPGVELVLEAELVREAEAGLELVSAHRAAARPPRHSQR